MSIKCGFVLTGPNELCGPNVWLTRILPALKTGFGVDPLGIYLDRSEADISCEYVNSLVRSGISILKLRSSSDIRENIRSIVEIFLTQNLRVIIPNYSVAAYFASGILKKSKVGSLGIIHSDDPFYRDIEKYFVTGDELWRVTSVACVSEFLSERVGASRVGSYPPVTYIPYGVPRISLRGKKNSCFFEVIYCGRFIEYQKRINRTVNVCQSILREIDGTKITFIGDGPDRGVVENFAHLNEKNVQVLKWLDAESVMELMAAGQVLILLSDFEGMSIAMVEAMSVGLVPIVSNISSGVNQLIEHGVNGFVVDPNDQEMILSIIRQLKCDPVKLHRMSNACREIVVRQGLYLYQTAPLWADVIKATAKTASDLQVQPASKVDAIESFLEQLPPPSRSPNGIGWEDLRYVIIKAKEINRLCRKIFIWGVGSGGLRVFDLLEKEGVIIEAFIDSDISKYGSTIRDKIVYPPARLTETSTTREVPFVIIATIFKDEVSGELKKINFKEFVDYIEAW
jgi:colanic acid/amylovoran biosynthesis glycosyltransferase